MSSQVEKLEFAVEGGLGRIRLDDYLFARLGMLSRMYLRELVRTNQVLVNGEYANIGVKLRANDFVEVVADMSRGTAMRPENIPLDIVYEDGAVVVVNKPAGMLVHPTHRDKNGTLLNALTFYLNGANAPTASTGGIDTNARSLTVAFPPVSPDAAMVRPGLVHRLDRETSGLIVVAKSVAVHRRLAREFLKKRVEKRYVAMVEGSFKDDEGKIQTPIGRFADKKLWDVKTGGKISVTRYRVLRRFDDSTLVELEPVTGRTNQLRIHCASVGHPIVGDTQRGGRAYERVCLHAFKLTLRHPTTMAVIQFEIPVPDNFSAA